MKNMNKIRRNMYAEVYGTQNWDRILDLLEEEAKKIAPKGAIERRYSAGLRGQDYILHIDFLTLEDLVVEEVEGRYVPHAQLEFLPDHKVRMYFPGKLMDGYGRPFHQ